MRGQQAPIAVRGRVFLARGAPAGLVAGVRAGGETLALPWATPRAARAEGERVEQGPRRSVPQHGRSVAWTRANSAADGQPVASASQTCLTVIRMRAPIFSRVSQIRFAISPRAQYTSS